MPRILRNYLISFLIIGLILGIVHLLGLYFNSEHPNFSFLKKESFLTASSQ